MGLKLPLSSPLTWRRLLNPMPLPLDRAKKKSRWVNPGAKKVSTYTYPFAYKWHLPKKQHNRRWSVFLTAYLVWEHKWERPCFLPCSLPSSCAIWLTVAQTAVCNACYHKKRKHWWIRWCPLMEWSPLMDQPRSYSGVGRRFHLVLGRKKKRNKRIFCHLPFFRQKRSLKSLCLFFNLRWCLLLWAS